MVRSADPAARPGDVVSIYDKAGQFFGRGLYNPRSQIVLRVLTQLDEPVDDAFWRRRLASAVELRQTLGLSTETDAYRLVHSEGDALSGLVAERYADCLVLELFSLGMVRRAGEFVATLAELLGPPSSLDRPDRVTPTWRVVLRADRQMERIEGFRVPPADERAASVTIREHGLRYRINAAAGHKTGFFCDQRENRRRFAALTRDASVLDVCCYSGGFGLCAKVLGGAREVMGVDLDEAAIALARDNANLNQARIEHVHADAFMYLRQLRTNGRQFDATVLDPPKFAPSRAEYEEALQKYHDLNALGMAVVRPGGLLLTCSCSGLVSRDVFLETVHRASRRAGRSLQLIHESGAGPDHPVMLNCPESAYLKAIWLRVL